MAAKPLRGRLLFFRDAGSRNKINHRVHRDCVFFRLRGEDDPRFGRTALNTMDSVLASQGRTTWFLRKVAAVVVGESFGGQSRSLRSHSLYCQPAIAFAVWRRAFVLVEYPVVQGPCLRWRTVS